MADCPEIETPIGTSGETATTVAHARLAKQVARLTHLDPLVRADAPDAVHRMRVANRRLRSLLATYRPLLDRAVTDPVRGDLKWLGGLLGPVRDAEVVRERLLADLDRLPEDEVHGGARDFVDEELRGVHDRAHRRAVEAMTTERYRGLLDRLQGLADDPPWRDGATTEDVGRLRQRVRHDWRRLARRVADLEGLSDEEYATGLHEVRKAAKRARYAAEPLRSIDGAEAKRFVRSMKRLQSSLGLLQDTVVARMELTRLADLATREGGNAFALGVLQARADQEAADQRARFPEHWRRASRKKLRRWIAGRAR